MHTDERPAFAHEAQQARFLSGGEVAALGVGHYRRAGTELHIGKQIPVLRDRHVTDVVTLQQCLEPFRRRGKGVKLAASEQEDFW